MNDKVKVDLTKQPWVVCSEGNSQWENSIMFKRISPIMTGNGQEQLVPLEVVICKKCGKVPAFYADRVPDIPKSDVSECTITHTDAKAPK